MSSELLAALRRVYGDDPKLLAAQAGRYQQALDAFRRRYGPGLVRIVRAPGRVNLIGEHTDYNQGYVMPIALDKDVLLLVRPRDDQQVAMANIEPEFGSRTFKISEDIPHQPVGDWANYAQGPAQLLEQEAGPGLRGYDGLVCGQAPWGIPRGAGLSSSSALTVASAVALVAINGLPLQGAPLADLCGRAEWYVGTRGGIMDQFISLLAQRDHALFLDCRPSEDASYHYHHVPLPAGYALVVVDSQVRHRNTGPDFNRRVVEGRIGVRLLQAVYPKMRYLRDAEGMPWAELECYLPGEIDVEALAQQGISPQALLDSPIGLGTDRFAVRSRCRHVISENERVLRSVEALTGGSLALFRELMNQAHASARDDYGISTPELDCLVRLANEQPGAFGARLTGAGWGGCIVSLVAQERVSEFAQNVVQGYGEQTGRVADVFVCKPAAGAGLVFDSGG